MLNGGFKDNQMVPFSDTKSGPLIWGWGWGGGGVLLNGGSLTTGLTLIGRYVLQYDYEVVVNL